MCVCDYDLYIGGTTVIGWIGEEGGGAVVNVLCLLLLQ